MLIRTIMTTSVLTLSPGMSCVEAQEFFTEHKLRRAPVVEDGHVLGMITDRDLKHFLPWTIDEQEQRRVLGKSTYIGSILSPNLLFVLANEHIEKAAQLMLRARVGGLPVLDDMKLVGIVTESDLFRLFVRRTITQKGTRLVLTAPSGSPRLLDPAGICVRNQAKLYDLAMYPIDKERTSVVMQVSTENTQRLIDAFLGAGYELILTERH